MVSNIVIAPELSKRLMKNKSFSIIKIFQVPNPNSYGSDLLHIF